MSEQNNCISTAVKQMQYYINENLKEPITSCDIAKAAGYSQYAGPRS